MFCSKCGAEIKENSTFCPNCGNKLNNASTSAPVSLGAEKKPKNEKKKKGKAIVAVISILVVVVITAVIIINPFADKNGSSSIDSKKGNQWYIAEKAIDYSYSDYNLPNCKYKFIDNVQLSEISMDGNATIFTYDNNNRIMSMEISEDDVSFTYTEKGSKYVGQSDVYKDNNGSCYMIVKYNRANQLVLKEIYCNERIQSSTKYSYHSNGEVSQCISTYTDNNYCVETFNENGFATLLEYYNFDGALSYKQIFEYEDNRLTAKKTYDKNGELTGSEIMNESGDNSIKTVHYNNENEIVGFSEYFYDENDNLIEIKTYDTENNLLQHTTNVWRIM